MRTWKFGFAALAMLATVPSCGDDDGDSNVSTGGRQNTGGVSTGGRQNTGGASPTTGGSDTGEGGAGNAAGEGNAGGAEPEGGSPNEVGGAGGEGGSGLECNAVQDFVPPTEADDPGPACQAYAECMNDGCGEIYEPAFGPDWESGDLSGGACGPAVPCLEGCGCDEACLLGCVLTAPECVVYAGQLQTCVMNCAEDALACSEERN
jgi:hypothetical protein